MKTSKTGLIIRWALVALIYGIIFWFSSQPADDSTIQSNFIVDGVVKLYFSDIDTMPSGQAAATIDVLTVIVRKIAHFSVFAALGFFAYLAFVSIAKHGIRYLAAVGLSAGLAGLDEFHQTFVEGRAGMLSDVCIDTAGAAFGSFIMMTLAVLWAYSKLKKQN